MIFKDVIAWVFLLLAMFSLPCFADSPKPCAEADWVSPPALQDGVFDGTLKATCTLTGGQNIGIEALEAHFLDQAKEQSKTVLSGPSAEKYENFDSNALKVEMNLGELNLTADVHVAGDDRSRAIYSLVSSQVSASFPASMTKALDILIEVTREKNSPEYQLAITIHIQVKKPGWVPSAGFESASESIAKKKFKEQSAIQVEALQKLL